MDPYDHYDENPDHIVAGKAVEGACWMAGGAKDYPEHYKAGLQPAHIHEKHYHARSPHRHNLLNRLVDISSHNHDKDPTHQSIKRKGPPGAPRAQLRPHLA